MKKYRIISGAFDRTIHAPNPHEAVKMFADYVFLHNGLIDAKTYLYECDNNPNNVYLVVDVAETLKLNKITSQLK